MEEIDQIKKRIERRELRINELRQEYAKNGTARSKISIELEARGLQAANRVALKKLERV